MISNCWEPLKLPIPAPQVTKVETNRKMAHGESLNAKNGQSAAKLKEDSKMYLITKEQYLQNLQQRFPEDDITVLDPFTAAKDPVIIKCNQCGQIFNYKAGTTLYNKRRKHFCPLCNSKSVLEMRQACREQDISITEIKFNVIESWGLHCNKCGLDFSRAPSNWLKKSCPNCGMTHSGYSKELRQKMIDDIFGIGEFEVLSDGAATERFTIRHKCGFIRNTQYSAFIRSKGCPKCSGTMSKGERKIVDYLTGHQIKYIPQKKIENSQQSFDFFFPQINVALEYNGEQHYKPIVTFGGEERFLQQQEYDRKKAEYCKENNITLKIISYKEFEDIESILDDFFKKFNDQSKDVEKD